ncbi:chemical-damaging agent resistance protein C, partial [Proteus mirabilis]
MYSQKKRINKVNNDNRYSWEIRIS